MNIFDNPFYILGASPRDNREKIIELAQEKSLTLDPAIVTEAKNILTNPRKRISAEIAWFPGLSKSKIEEIIQALKDNKSNYLDVKSLPDIVRINMISSLLSESQISPGSIFMLAKAYEKLKIDSLLKVINEDREIAEISLINDKSMFEEALQEHKDNCIRHIHNILLKYPQKKLTDIMLEIVDKTADSDTSYELIDTLIDKFYTLQVQEILTQKQESINIMAKKIKTQITTSPNSQLLSDMVSEFITMLEIFDEIMQPIQVSLMQRGLEHKPSKDIAYLGRDVAIDLYNKANQKTLSEKLLKVLKRLFVEIGSFDEKIDEDLETFENFKREDEEQEKNILCSISQKKYRFEVTQKQFRVIKNEEVIYLICLDEIETIRGGLTTVRTKSKYSSITSTEVYTVLAVGNKLKGELVIYGLSEEMFDLFSSFSDNYSLLNELPEGNFTRLNSILMKNAGIKILNRMLNELVNGGNIYGYVFDNGVELSHFGMSKFFIWKQVKIESISGYFHIVSKTSNHKCILSYQKDMNVGIIRILLGKLYKEKANEPIYDTLCEAWNISPLQDSKENGNSLRIKPSYGKFESKSINLKGFSNNDIGCIIVTVIFVLFLLIGLISSTCSG